MTSKYFCSQRRERTALPVRELRGQGIIWQVGKGARQDLLPSSARRKENRTSNSQDCHKGRQHQGTTTPQLLVNFMSHRFVGSTEGCDHVSDGSISCRGLWLSQKKKVIWLRRLLLQWHPTLWAYNVYYRLYLSHTHNQNKLSTNQCSFQDEESVVALSSPCKASRP